MEEGRITNLGGLAGPVGRLQALVGWEVVERQLGHTSRV